MVNKRNCLILSMILLNTLACTIFVGGPDYPEPPIPISTEAVLSLQEEMKTAVAAGAITGQVTLIMSEVQLTSYLASKFSSDQSPIFDEPQVVLRDGQMRIFGKTQQGYFAANVGLVLTVGTDVDGNPELQLTSADFGPFPLPDGLNKAITAIIEEAYTGALGPVATGFRINTITINDGLMMIVGKIR